MSRGNDSRSANERGERGARSTGEKGASASRTSRSSIPMTVERARAIQSHADRTGDNQDFKARTMSAADQNEAHDGKGV